MTDLTPQQIFEQNLAYQRANGGASTPEFTALQNELLGLKSKAVGRALGMNEIALDPGLDNQSVVNNKVMASHPAAHYNNLTPEESSRLSYLNAAVNGEHKTWLAQSGIVPAAALAAISAGTYGAATGALPGTEAAGGALEGSGGFTSAYGGGSVAADSALPAGATAVEGTPWVAGTGSSIADTLSSWAAPLRVAGTIGQAAGTLLQQGAAKDAQKAKDALYQGQSTLQGQEFDKRAQEAGASDVTSAQLSQEAFNARQKLQSDANQLLSKETIAQIQRESTSDSDYYDTLHKVLGDQTTAQHSARDNYNATVDAENANQTAARQAADARVGSLVSESGVPVFESDRAGATAGRMSLAESLMGKAPTPGAITSPTTSTALDAASRQAEIRAGRSNLAGANINSYADATTAGARRAEVANEDLANIDRHARATEANLPTALAVPQTAYAQAGTRADEQRTVASNNQIGNKAISAAQFNRNTIPAKYYSDTIDNALADYYKSRLGSEDTYTKSIIGASNDYQNQNAAITDRKIANTKGTSTLGDYFTGIGNAVGGGVSLADLGNSYKKITSAFA